MAAMGGNDDYTKVDPEGLIVSGSESDWDIVKKANPELLDPFDEDTSVAACRAWYDVKDYGKPFCCNMMSMDMSALFMGRKVDVFVVDSSSTTNAEPFESNLAGSKILFEFGALTFNGAQALASAAGILASVIVLMN